ncbi:MAG TPA: hypothetical protein VKO16_04215 [Polyangia bacterium]|nr:hypothetical protein [Polyangia bacterium]
MALVATAATARAQTDAPDSERYTLRAELGAEYDTNAHRAEVVAGAVNPPAIASPLERVVVSGTLSDVVADRQAIALAATVAGKLYDANGAHDEDVAIVSSSAAWQTTVNDRSALTLSAAYYEAFQGAPHNLDDASLRRNFRSLAPSLQLDWSAAEGVTLAVSAGYRMFVFKPDRDIDFDAPTAGVELRWARQPDTGAEWEGAVGAAFERRTFGGPAFIGCPAPAQPIFDIPCSGPDTRVDDFLMSHLDVTRTGRVLLGLGYAFQFNLSNSFGETVRRHFAIGRFAVALPGGFMLAARAELLFASYRDPVLVGLGQSSPGSAISVESIEDETRSSVRIDLSREVGERMRLIARYTFYANELGATAPVSYRRQTLLLSLAFALEK